MHTNPHRNNSDFQLRNFIAGSCHTADAAWCLLYEQYVDIQLKLAFAKASVVRRKAKKIQLARRKQELDSLVEFEQIAAEDKYLEYEADLMEFEAEHHVLEWAVIGAEEELATIKNMMDELEPHRKYGHLSVTQAAQACQEEEWLGEFKHRIENYVLTSGMVPQDQLTAMRKHPQFTNNIVPHIKQVVSALAHTSGTDGLDLLTNDTFMLEYKGETNDRNNGD